MLLRLITPEPKRSPIWIYIIAMALGDKLFIIWGILKSVEDGCIVVVTVLFKYLPIGAGLFWELFIKTKPEEVGFGWAIVVFQKWLVLLCARPRPSEEIIAMRAEKRIASGVKTKPREISRLG
jgi:hypothetical protein